MKDSAVLLNFSRDKLVNDVDLLIALETGALAAYVTDFPNDALVGRDKVILLPHLGASTEEAEENCAVMAVEQMMNYFENGNIINSVNFPKVDMGPLEKGVRLAFFTKDCDDPVVLVQEQLIKCDIKAAKIQGANKGKYGYVLVEADLDTAPSIVFYDSKIIKHVTFK